jgi:hypothetical protein
VVGAESGAVVDFIPAGTVASLADDSTASRVYRTGRTAQLAQGLSPTALSEGGLGPALGDLLERSPLPVELDVTPERFPETIEWPPIT